MKRIHIVYHLVVEFFQSKIISQYRYSALRPATDVRVRPVPNIPVIMFTYNGNHSQAASWTAVRWRWAGVS